MVPAGSGQRPVGVVPLSGVAKSESLPEQAPRLLTAGGPVLQRISGDSDQVARMTTLTEPVILDITHQGRGHFVVDALDAGLHSRSQLVYTDGPFACLLWSTPTTGRCGHSECGRTGRG
ncbi:hypothetical protein ACGH7X_32655 [Streptomyces sp. BBFR51]|uniref:hypothetical protein n=1 Tax=Streptomyces sp. BBFR51 TaxID=3372856 RepID=UPI0037DC3106